MSVAPSPPDDQERHLLRAVECKVSALPSLSNGLEELSSMTGQAQRRLAYNYLSASVDRPYDGPAVCFGLVSVVSVVLAEREDMTLSYRNTIV